MKDKAIEVKVRHAVDKEGTIDKKTLKFFLMVPKKSNRFLRAKRHFEKCPDIQRQVEGRHIVFIEINDMLVDNA